MRDSSGVGHGHFVQSSFEIVCRPRFRIICLYGTQIRHSTRNCWKRFSVNSINLIPLILFFAVRVQRGTQSWAIFYGYRMWKRAWRSIIHKRLESHGSLKWIVFDYKDFELQTVVVVASRHWVYSRLGISTLWEQLRIRFANGLQHPLPSILAVSESGMGCGSSLPLVSDSWG